MIREKILPKLLLLNTRLVVGTYTAVTLPFYAALQRPWRMIQESKRKRTVLEKSADGSYTFWRRHGPPVTHPNGYHTCDSFKEVLAVMREKEDHNRVRLSHREVLAEKIKLDDKGQPLTQDGKVVKEIQLAKAYKWLTLGQVLERMDGIARGLASLGVKPRDKVIIYADTRLEWFLSALALFELNSIIVTLFSNLGQAGLIHGMKQTEAMYVITSIDLLPRMATFLEETPNIEKIFYIRHAFQKDQKIPNLDKFPAHIQIVPLDEVEEIGKKAPKLNVPLPKVDDVALIMYTSGTTGTPKAVILQNRQVNGALKALTSNVNDLADEAHRHIYSSFLPLAHIMGLTFELFLFTGGVRIGYSSPTTLTDSSPAHPVGQPGDLKLLQPTVLITVPLILDRIVKEIYLKLSLRSPNLLPPLFTYLMDYKIRWTKRGFDTPIINKIICQRVREQFGGKLEFVISGGAPLNARTEELIRAALNVRLMQGYGLTETTGGIVGMMRQDIDTGKVGYPLDGIRVRLKSWPEGGYTVEDKPHPRGEVLIGGDSIGAGYYKLEEETKEAFSEDATGRWFHTGDIATIYPSGSIQIVDRKKDLAKLPNGEYISLGKIESVIKTASLVENACIAVSEKISDIVALVTPNDKLLRLLAKDLGKDRGLSREQLCKDDQIQKIIIQEVIKICSSAGLHRRETPVAIHICAEEWLPDNELLTAAFKLKRKNVLDFYCQDVDRLFAQLLQR